MKKISSIKKGSREGDVRRLGVHVSAAGGLFRVLDRIRALRINAAQIFLKNARQWNMTSRNPDDAARFRDEVGEMRLYLAAHGGYLINLCGEGGILEKSIKSLGEELSRAALLGITDFVIHPGSHGGRGEMSAASHIACSLDRILEEEGPPSVRILLETTAGQGSSFGYRFEHLRDILAASRYPGRLSICLDTSHVFAAGYDLSCAEGVRASLEEFDRIIGLERLRLVHLNDSRQGYGSRVDRHEHIGMGRIGRAGFKAFLADSRLKDIPLILETPKFDDLKADRRNLSIVRGLLKG